MKAMKGKADPGMVNKLLKELLAQKTVKEIYTVKFPGLPGNLLSL